MTTYSYQNKLYNTLQEVESAVSAFKDKLDNQPTTYCEVKEVTGSDEAGWTAVTDELTDAEILSLDPAKRYYIYSQYDGESFYGLTAEETTTKKNQFRNAFATRVRANTLCTMDAPTNEDMSIYVV